MLNIGLISLISIDFLLLAYGKIRFYVKVFKVLKIKDLAKKFKNNIPAIPQEEDVLDTEDEKELVDEEHKLLFLRIISWILKLLLFVLKLIGALILIAIAVGIVVILIGFATSSIWGTILLAIYKNSVYAVLFLLGINALYFLTELWMHKKIGIAKKQTQKVLIMDVIKFSMLALLLYLATFGYPIVANSLIIIPFQWDIVLNNFVSIILPMLFYALIITNIFALIIRFRNMIIKDREKHNIIRLHQLLFIFIASCFFGIIYLTDIDFGFMSELERNMYLQTLEIVKWIITSAFIPLFLYSLNNYKKVKPSTKRIRRRTSSR